MAKEHAEQFHAHLGSDSELRDAVAAHSEKILDIAREHGLHFTRDELAQVFREKFDDSADDDGGADPLTSILSERPGR